MPEAKWEDLIKAARERIDIVNSIKSFTLISGQVVDVAVRNDETEVIYDNQRRVYVFVSTKHRGVVRLREDAIAMFHIDWDEPQTHWESVEAEEVMKTKRR